MNKLMVFAIAVLLAGCKEKFNSPVPPVVTGYLVVEGVVNNDGGLTIIRLSRTTDLNNTNTIQEKGAIVKLEDSNNSPLIMLESGDGNYSIDNLHLDTSLKYRLTITTSNNEEYVSDLVSVRNNPPIDTLNWVRDDKGVTIFINTHDPQNNTLYYQWDYLETWEFRSARAASLKYVIGNGIPVGVEFRLPTDPNISTCWQYNPSTNILLGSSAKLSQDVIHLPIANIPPESWKLGVLYSILVKQYTWSKEGFEFLERMKKNTETVGSVFDAQPSELNGNIRCVSNPSQPVIGFFNICTIQEKRIFIRNNEVPGWGYRMDCREVVIENNPDSILKKGAGKLPTTVSRQGSFGYIVDFFAADDQCVDCTLRGSNVKPTYWP
jgi:hypothetical protein